MLYTAFPYIFPSSAPVAAIIATIYPSPVILARHTGPRSPSTLATTYLLILTIVSPQAHCHMQLLNSSLHSLRLSPPPRHRMYGRLAASCMPSSSANFHSATRSNLAFR